ncbi:ribosomal protein L7/L12 [Streptomyces sp. NPDC056373]|uniref:ribosomal protein L7/L12 n=1 Tax=Streptomyces sp. NPDC056373 TaxID=3345798 RepID=UPI0035E0BB02
MGDEYVWLVCDDTPHDVLLTDPGARVLDVVQVVRRLTGLSLWHSKVLVTRTPAVVLARVPEEDATAAASALRAAGAVAEAREQQGPDSHWS